MAISVGSVAVRVVPSAQTFAKDMQAQILPKIATIGVEIGKEIAAGIGRGLGDPLSAPLDESSKKQQSKAPRQGEAVAGAFAKGFQNRLRAAFAALPKAEIDADSSPADRKVAELRARLEALSGKTVGVDLDAGEALAEIAAIKAELQSLGRNAPVQVRADTAAAAAELAAVEEEVNRLDGRTASLHVGADVSSAISGIGILAASIGALAAIPVGATLGAGILSLIGPLGAAGAGFGGLAAVAVPSISHISDALKAQHQAATASAAGAAQSQARALAEAGAQQQLAAAVRNAGVAHAQAAAQVRTAEQQLTSAQVAATNAQRALNQARLDAQRQLQDMANQVADAQLAVRQSVFDVADAQRAYNQVISNPQATQDQIDRSKLALDAAKQQQREQQLQLKRLQQDQASADRAGVNGSNAVRSARQQLTAANQQVANSERALAAARANVTRADQAAQDQIASARRAVAQASLQGASANGRLAASMAALSGPEKKLLGDVKGLKSAFSDWARSLQPDVLPLFSHGIDLLKDQLPSLTPFVQGAAHAVDGLLTDVGNAARSPFWTQFRQNLADLTPTAITDLGHAAGNVATGMAGIVNAFLPYAPQMLGFITRITGEFANWGKNLGTSNGFQQFMAYVQKAGPQILQTIIEIAKAVGNIVSSLSGFGLTSLVGIRGLATVVAGMSPTEIQAVATAFIAVRGAIALNSVATSSAKAIGGLSDALASGGKKGPVLARGMVLAGKGVKNLGATAVTSGKNLVTGLVGGFRDVNSAYRDNASLTTRLGAGIRSQTRLWKQQATAVKAAAAAKYLDVRASVASTVAQVRQKVATIATTVAEKAAKVATVAWTAVQWLWNAAMDANPIVLIIIGITALVAAVIYAYTHFGWFRTAVQAAWNGIKTASLFVWHFVLKPIFDAIKFYIVNILIPYFKLLGSGVVLAFRGIAAIALWLWHNAIHPAWTGIQAVIRVVWAGIKLYMAALQTEWRLVAAVARWLWHNVMAPVWHGIQAVISGVWNNGIKPVFNAVRSAIGKVGDAFHAGASAIKTAWAKIKDYTKAPINFVIGTVYDKGIVGLWNKVMGWLHLPNSLKLGTVPMLASGGELSAAQPISPMVTNRPTAIVGEGGRHPEYVIPTDPKYRGRAQALWAAAGSDMQMLAGGGILGSVLKTVKNAAGKAVGLGKDALGLLEDPKKIWDALAAPILNQAKGLGTSPWGKAAAAIPPKLMDQTWAAAKQLIETFQSAFGGGGSAMVDLARTQLGYHEGAGNSNKYSHALGRPSEEWCFAAGTLVDTPTGLVPIEELRPGSQVLTPSGAVAYTSRLLTREKPIFRLTALGVPDTLVTEDHPYWVMRRTSPPNRRRELAAPGWVKVRDIKRGDMIALPVPVDGTAPFDPALAYVLGMYLADGHRLHSQSARGVQISDAAADRERIIAALKSAGYEDVRIVENRTCLQFTVYDDGLYELCGQFGDLAHGKRLPGEVFAWDRIARQALLDGYMDGDGSYDDRNGHRATTVSRVLAHDLGKLIRSLGWVPNIQMVRPAGTMTIEGREVHTRDTYGLKWKTYPSPRPQTFEVDGKLWVPIRSITPTERVETVYDLTVPGEHAFVADGAHVSNCADFIDWLALKTGNRSAVPWTASAPGMARAFGGRYHSGTSGAVAGDILFFGGSKAGIYHVGLASGASRGGSVPTIAGNSSNQVRAYTGTGIAGYAAPNYPNPGSGIVSPGSLVHASPTAAKGWARQNLKTQGWGQDQFSPLERLWTRESGWRWNALNRSSGAYGIPQSLPASKMRSAGSDWHDNAGTQIKWGLGYIKSRYGSPAGAWAHSQRTGWYDEGGWLPPGPSLVYNGTGSPEPVLTGRQWDALIDGRSGGGATEYHAHFDGMTQAAYQTQARSAFHAMSVQDANRNRVGRRR